MTGEDRGNRARTVRLVARRLVDANGKWRVFFDHIVDGAGREVKDYLVLASHRDPTRHLTGVTVLPVCDGAVVLLRNYRHAVESFVWEAVRGFIDDGETPSEAAHRELAEEAGLVCPKEAMEPLGFCLPDGSTMAARAALFAATACRPGQARHEDELGLGERHLLPLERAAHMLKDGEIEDAATAVVLHRYLGRCAQAAAEAREVAPVVRAITPPIDGHDGK